MQIIFFLYEGMTALDAIGPHEVLSRLPGVTIKRVAHRVGAVTTASAGLVMNAEYGLQDIHQADVLVIPGGGHAPSFHDDLELMHWIQAIDKTTQWTTSICTGSLILGAAGLLQGKRATSHWAVMDKLPAWGAIPTDKRMVTDGKIMTAAGVSAGIDMALALAAKLTSETVAKSIQLSIEYDPQPPFDAGSIHKAPAAIVEALRKHYHDQQDKHDMKDKLFYSR